MGISKKKLKNSLDNNIELLKKKITDRNEKNTSFPKSFVIKRGKISKELQVLLMDWRKIMSPYSSLKLKESKKSSLEDYIRASGILSVTHLIMFSETKKACYLRVVQLPHGPTVVFKILDYSTSVDIKKNNAKLVCSTNDFSNSPILVLHGLSKMPKHFHNTHNSSSTDIKSILSSSLASLFPKMNTHVHTQMSCFRRLLLFHFDPDTELIKVRHYSIGYRKANISKGIQHVVNLLSKKHSQIDFSDTDKIAETLVNYSNTEKSHLDNDEISVEIPVMENQTVHNENMIVKLHEIGPRLTLQLIKIESNILGGEILYHKIYNQQTRATKSVNENEHSQKRKRKLESLYEEGMRKNLRQEENHTSEENDASVLKSNELMSENDTV